MHSHHGSSVRYWQSLTSSQPSALPEGKEQRSTIRFNVPVIRTLSIKNTRVPIKRPIDEEIDKCAGGNEANDMDSSILPVFNFAEAAAGHGCFAYLQSYE
jgi:hypothetical protein